MGDYWLYMKEDQTSEMRPWLGKEEIEANNPNFKFRIKYINNNYLRKKRQNDKQKSNSKKYKWNDNKNNSSTNYTWNDKKRNKEQKSK